MKIRLTLIISFFFLIGVVFPEAVSANPVKKLFEEGMAYYAQEKYDASIKKFEKLLEIYPEFAPAYHYLGLAHKNKGTVEDEVLYLFNMAIKIDPNYAESHEQLSKAYYELAEFDKAIEHGEKAVKLKPDFLTARLALAWIYLLGKQEQDPAITHFSYVVKRYDIPYAVFGLGLAYFMNDERAQVMDIITQLKGKSEDKLAANLENMLRQGYFDPDNNNFITPLVAPKKRDPSVSVKDIQNMSGAELRVRLRGTPQEEAPRRRSSDTAQNQFNPPQQQPLTGEQRLRQLQNNSSNYPY